MKALDNVIYPFKIYELRKRILFTLALVAIYRIGAYIPTPGVDGEALSRHFMGLQHNLLGFFNLLTGGALENFSVFGLGIMPYISASIIMSLLTSAVPRLERLRKEGEIGRRKINQYTRYLTLAIGVVQALGLSLYMQGETADGRPIVIEPGIKFCVMTVLTLTTGTAFVMWLGEQITERGIGNGASIIIFANIIAAVPTGITRFTQQVASKEINPFNCILLIVIMGVTIPLVIVMLQGHRKITVQYAKRIIGRRMYGGQSSYIPLQINSAGVIPVIFASAALAFFGSFFTFINPQQGSFLRPIVDFFRMNIPAWVGDVIYYTLYVAGIIFFTYFYTAVILNPQDVSENIRKGGGFIPGIRPGRPTADYIERILKRVTFVGAVFLAAVALLPEILISQFHVPFYFGGTSLLIVIGVALDTLRQIESHLLMSRYEGFIKKAKIRGRF